MIKTVVTEPDVVEDVQRAGPPARQGPGGRGGPGRLHRQRAAVRVPEPRGLDGRVALRHPRGRRRGDAARLRVPDGSAGAARPDRPRHGVRDSRHDVQAGPQPAARAGPDPQADGHRGPARPEDRAAASTPTSRRTRRSWSTTSCTPVVSADARAIRPVKQVGVVGSGTMAVGIIEVLAKAGYDVLYVARGTEKVDRVRGGAGTLAGEGRPARQAVLRGARRGAAPDRAVRRSSTTWRSADLVIEAVVEELSVKQALFETFDEICKPGAILATTTSSLPVIDLAMATKRPARRGRAALLQPGAGDEARRGRQHRQHHA